MNDIMITLLLCGFLLGLFSGHLSNQSKEQYRKLKEKYNALAEATGHAELAFGFLSEEQKAEILALKNEGKQVAAIKKVRSLTDMGLAEAKQFVEKL